MEYNQPNKSESNTQEKEGLSVLPDKQYVQDCSAIERLPECTTKEKYISFKTNGEKYFPHFKAKVTSYALKHSVKNAALTFKVNKDTVASWVHQSKSALPSKQKNCKILACLFEEESEPDDKFIHWLRTFDKNQVFSRQTLTEKVNEIINSFEQKQPNKKNLWFFLYAKRLKGDKSDKKINIKYPHLFKQEVVNYANHFSKKKTSIIFNIDRKRICEWTSDFKNGTFKKRDVSKYLTDPEVDSKIWDWYCNQENKPNGKEVRLKAARLYEEAGYSHMRCSPGWYYRWRMRHQLPTVRMSQASRDSELLTWVLMQIDENRSIVHSDLLKQASLFKGSDFKASSSWVFRFTKRYISQLHSGSENINLPGILSQQVDDYRQIFSTVKLKNNIHPRNIIAFDELPLNFASSEPGKNDCIFGKSDWTNCQASVILCCSADGNVLPTALILKDPIDENLALSDEINPILVQENCINDQVTVEKWFKNISNFYGSPSILICDSYEPHKYLKNNLIEELGKQNTELMIIPGGCSSHLQPILLGISRRFKMEVYSSFERWYLESGFPEITTLRLPKNIDVFKWVQKAHRTLASTCKDLIKDSFTKAGFIEKS